MDQIDTSHGSFLEDVRGTLINHEIRISNAEIEIKEVKEIARDTSGQLFKLQLWIMGTFVSVWGLIVAIVETLLKK